jgi:DnaJ-class molecular chaperone
MLQNDPYEILNIPQNSSYESIKTAYQKLLRIYHPDKSLTNESNENFLLIQEAWKLLSDNDFRKAYDDSLIIKNQMINVSSSEVSFSELIFKDSNYYWNCRCGDVFEVI